MIKLNFIEFITIVILICLFASVRVEVMYYLKQYYNQFKEWVIRFID